MWPLVVLAASALLNAKNNAEARDRQNQFANAMQQYQLTKARESRAATEGFLAKQTPQARADELNALTNERGQSMRDTVAAAQAAAPSPQIAGKLSPDYRRSEEAAAGTVAERTRRAIQNLSTMGAPGAQQLSTGLRFGKAAGVVDASNTASANVGQGYATDISNVRPNPMIDLISRIGMTVGGAGLGLPGGEAPAIPESSGFPGDPGNVPAGYRPMSRIPKPWPWGPWGTP